MTADPTPDPLKSEYVQSLAALGYVKVLEVLREWDPIGVFEFDSNCPRDEYDSYAAPIVRMLDAAVPREEIVQHLGSIATDNMGLGSFDRLHTTVCVQELIEFWRDWKSWKKSEASATTELDALTWHVLDATADDWESFDQIEPHIREYCGSMERAAIATAIINARRAHLLLEMPHEDLQKEATSGDDILLNPEVHWFGMSGIGRMLWEMNSKKYCDK